MKTAISSVKSIQKIYFGLVTPSEVPSIGFCFCCPIQNPPFFFVICWNIFVYAKERTYILHSKLNWKNGFFRLFHIHKHTNTYSHLWKEFQVAASNIAICSYWMQQQWSKYMYTRWNVRGHESVSRETWIRCLGRWCYCGSFSLFFSLYFRKFRERKKISGISHQKLHSLWLLPSLTPLYSWWRTIS